MASLLEKYFDEQTMSVHIKSGMPVMAKKGVPGNWNMVPVRPKVVSEAEAKKMYTDLIAETTKNKGSFLEIDKKYSKVLQLQHFRVVVVMPPLGSTYEITAARPLKKLSLADYHFSDRLKERFLNKAEGVLIAGRPGQGKSTFAQAMIGMYAQQNKIIKTIEAPRDLQVPPEVTQYSLFHSSQTEIRDILLLSRPDYTFFDEVRNREDFELFKDLRLAGIGMLGVIHGAKPIDAVQRFVGKIDLGMIPEIVDTLVFIEAGMIKKVYALELKVKVPHGMFEQDLARPVVEITDFNTGKPEYEMYTFGSEIVVLPLLKNTEEDPRDRTERRTGRSYPERKWDEGLQVFPKFFRDKKGFRLVFGGDVLEAVLVFENEQTFSVTPDRGGYVKVSKKGRLPEMLRRMKFRAYKIE